MSAPAPGASRHEFVDLHTHSTASDGARSPRDVIVAAHAAQLAAVALTDHDTVAGLPEALAAGAELGVRVIRGVELSVVEGGTETHLLGLHLAELSELERRLSDLRDMRLSRARRIVERLNTMGVGVTLDAVLAQAAGGAIGRPHVARALIDGGFAADLREAFERYLGNGRPGFVPKDNLPMADAIAVIHQAGGLAILAHPGPQGTRERVTAFAALGLDGIEVLHPSHGWDEAQRLDALAAECGMVRSGGSDWHGGTDGARTLGMMRVPAHWLADQEARLRARGARSVASAGHGVA